MKMLGASGKPVDLLDEKTTSILPWTADGSKIELLKEETAYRLKAGDLVVVTLEGPGGMKEQTEEEVDERGAIRLRYIGDVPAAGKTTTILEREAWSRERRAAPSPARFSDCSGCSSSLAIEHDCRRPALETATGGSAVADDDVVGELRVGDPTGDPTA